MIIKDNSPESLEYLQPRAEEFSFSPEGMVCESPDDGESEDVGYEDWN